MQANTLRILWELRTYVNALQFRASEFASRSSFSFGATVRGDEDRTHDLRLKSEISDYTPTHAVQQEPIESARRAKSFRLVSDGSVPRSRTITRTKWPLPFLIRFLHEPKGQRDYRRCCNCSGPYHIRVFPRTLFVQDDIHWRLASVHCHVDTPQGERLAGARLSFANHRNHLCDGQNTGRNTVSPQFSRAAHSAGIPDVPLQVFGLNQVTCDCPRLGRNCACKLKLKVSPKFCVQGNQSNQTSKSRSVAASDQPLAENPARQHPAQGNLPRHTGARFGEC